MSPGRRGCASGTDQLTSAWQPPPCCPPRARCQRREPLRQPQQPQPPRGRGQVDRGDEQPGAVGGGADRLDLLAARRGPQPGHRAGGQAPAEHRAALAEDHVAAVGGDVGRPDEPVAREHGAPVPPDDQRHRHPLAGGVGVRAAQEGQRATAAGGVGVVGVGGRRAEPGEVAPGRLRDADAPDGDLRRWLVDAVAQHVRPDLCRGGRGDHDAGGEGERCRGCGDGGETGGTSAHGDPQVGGGSGASPVRRPFAPSREQRSAAARAWADLATVTG